jgi:FkbM family methyltransferase
MNKFPDDIQAWLMARFSGGGTFVEAGAHDGVGDSQTLRLEQAEWDGLCVEPSSYHIGLRRSRKCQCDPRALWKEDGVVNFTELWGTELSGVAECFGDHWDRSKYPARVEQVRAVTLTTMLREHEMPNRIEFLCLDTEGSESLILGAHDFEQYKFSVVMVEHNGVEHRRNALRELLTACGYEFHSDNGTDSLFVEMT